MPGTFVSDIRHFLDEDQCLPQDLPGPALNIALFLGSIIGWVTSRAFRDDACTNVPCRRMPGRRRCLGDVFADFDLDDPAAIIWECSFCGENGVIRGWEGTLWDRRLGRHGTYAEAGTSARIGISFHSGGFVDRPLAWVVEHVAGIGYDGIEIVCGPDAHIRTSEPIGPQLTAARALLYEYGIQAAAINPYTQPAMVNIAGEGPDKAESAWRLLIDIAVELGSRTVNFLPGWLPDGDAEAWKLLIEVLRRLAKPAEDAGVNLAIHNHEGHIIDSPGKCLVLMDQVGSPNLKVLCDITNFHILGAEVDQAVLDLAPHIVHCHEKGVKGKYPFAQFLAPGEDGDELDFSRFASALADVDYSGYISVETFRWMREDKAEISYRMMSERLEELGLRQPQVHGR